MLSHKLRGAVIALTLLSLPASTTYACGCGRGLFGGTSTYYAPYTAAYAAYTPYVASYAPAGCGQTVNYLQQTAYRTVYVNSPVVAYSPVTACNACGGATTVLRPVTTYVTAARLVPYTTYSPVVTSVAPACAPACAPAAPVTAAYYAPAAPAAAPCCGASYSAPTTAGYAAAPTTAGYAAPPATVTPAPAYAAPSTTYSAPAVPGTVIRSLPPSPPSDPVTSPGSSAPPAAAPRTFDNSTPPAAEPQSRVISPSNDSSTNSSTSGVRRIQDHDDEDRTTAIPMRQARLIPVSATTTATPVKSTVWRAARD
jgi:hypothetical protein